VPKKLDADNVNATGVQEKVSFINDEAKFRWELFSDEMAFDKLHEGIRKFGADGETLKNVLREKLSA